ncbi:MAG: hypothetical protein SPJ62_11640 [Inconstantimicrobium porci]|uniref:hypothetical protein n=1 Tax=Inconstantimicrobium porci TaxID=2652291 RepID=UPI002A91F3A2|nr:hypothetical protein [Inconstantimicrobium porci]MDY5912630.1 hypothetical protein [Inconstantimicrobium porci]
MRVHFINVNQDFDIAYFPNTKRFLVQIVEPYNEKMGVMRPFKYTIVFEKSI